jgi:hypothetical protein
MSKNHMADKNTRRDDATRALATVPPGKAFYFYREIGQPLDVSARNLSELAAVLKGIDTSSIRFHLERGDFENWFSMLGDQSLAKEVAALRGKSVSPYELRAKLFSMVKARLDQLSRIAHSK